MNDNKKQAIPAIRSVRSLLNEETAKNSTVCTVSDFHSRYMTGDESSDYINTLTRSPYGITYTELFYHNVKAGLKIVSPLLPKKDRAGNPYAWLVFSNSVGTKVILEYGMAQFITDYQNGLIKPDFDFYDVVEETKKIQTSND